ncbi:hypothetical protein P5673_025921, partial [Acropora cervicornis]
MGCIDNLLIDKALVEGATKNAKNISCVWIDVKEAFDSVAHNWLVTVLKDHGITKLWKTTLIVPTEKGTEKVGPIRIQRSILQGDSFCVNLFILCINSIAWYLRATEGYTFSHNKTSKITHTLFVDDLKSYHKNAVKAATIASNLESMFEDIGLHWGKYENATQLEKEVQRDASKGGKGRQELETLCKTTKIKTAHYLT